MIRLLIILFFVNMMFYSCSSSVETTEEEKAGEEEIYVFDEVPEDTFRIEQTPTETKLPEQYFAVQIGAFTTRERAESFAAESRAKLNKDIDISYSSEVNLFVVQLKPYFKLKSDAEKLRNELWMFEDFKDAWIVTVLR